MGNISFGCRVETGLAEYEQASALAQQAERHGFDSIWIRDHVAVPETTGDPNCLECFTTLAGLARDTERVGLGTLVVCTPWRNPALMAKMAATIDNMSHGRLILGLGAGSPGSSREFNRYGWELDPQGDRIRALAEAIKIMRLMWTEDAPSFEGRYHRIKDAVCDPKPAKLPPIIIGASGEQFALKNVARYADGWESASPIDEYRHKTEVVSRYCEEVGRDPATLQRLSHQIMVIDEPNRAKERLAAVLATKSRDISNRALVGEPEYIAERLRPFVDAGVNTIIAFFWESDPSAQMENIARFGDEVIPLLR